MKRISYEEINNMVDLWCDDHYQIPRGMFYSFNGNLWIGCDNSTHHCWIEVFETEEDVLKWLNDKYVQDAFGNELNEWANEE